MDENNELVKEFINASIRYGEYQKQGNSRGMDKQSKKIGKIENDIKKQGVHVLGALIKYLEHEDAYVRLHVALSIVSIEPVLCVLKIICIKYIDIFVIIAYIKKN